MPLVVDASSYRKAGKTILDEVKRIRAGLRLERFQQVAARALDDYALLDLDPAVQNNLAGAILNRRSGQLASRTRITRATISGREVSITIETRGIPYGLIHETGGTIRPRDKQFLTIPLPDALTPAGVLRKSAAEYLGNPSPFDATFINDRGTILGKRGEALTPLFVLRKKVEIPQRRWASKAVDDTLNSFLKRLERAVDDNLRRGF